MSGMPDTQTPDFLSLTPCTKARLIEADTIGKPWARLYAMHIHFSPVDLKENTFQLGRAESCDVIVNDQKLPSHLLFLISKVHFKIIREDGVVYIKDLSKNGTFLNGNKIGKDNVNILQNDDYISIGLAGLKVFVFKVFAPSEGMYLPAKLRKKYEVSRFLGKGACAEVKLVLDKVTLRAYALKKIVKAKSLIGRKHLMNQPAKIKREIEIMQSLEHPGIVQMHDIDETDECVYLILEYMEGGELTKIIRHLSEQEAKCVFYQIAVALNYLHVRGIIHRDLKPENVLLKSAEPNTRVKISDFGLSGIIRDDEEEALRTICGTPMYVAPEIISAQPYGPLVDVWSLGVVLYYMLSHELPFKAGKVNRLNTLIKSGTYHFDAPIWNDISDEAKDLVKRMMTVDASHRIKMLEVLSHPWLTSDNDDVERIRDTILAEQVTCVAFNSSDSSSLFSDDSASPPAKRSRSDH